MFQSFTTLDTDFVFLPNKSDTVNISAALPKFEVISETTLSNSTSSRNGSSSTFNKHEQTSQDSSRESARKYWIF